MVTPRVTFSMDDPLNMPQWRKWLFLGLMCCWSGIGFSTQSFLCEWQYHIFNDDTEAIVTEAMPCNSKRPPTSSRTISNRFCVCYQFAVHDQRSFNRSSQYNNFYQRLHDRDAANTALYRNSLCRFQHTRSCNNKLCWPTYLSNPERHCYCPYRCL